MTEVYQARIRDLRRPITERNPEIQVLTDAIVQLHSAAPYILFPPNVLDLGILLLRISRERPLHSPQPVLLG